MKVLNSYSSIVTTAKRKFKEEETLSRKEKLDLISKLTGKKFSSEKDALNYKDYENKNWEKIKELQKSLKESFLKRKMREGSLLKVKQLKAGLNYKWIADGETLIISIEDIQKIKARGTAEDGMYLIKWKNLKTGKIKEGEFYPNQQEFEKINKPVQIRMEAEGSGDGLLSDDIIEDLRTCNMSLQMVCMALKDNATEQTLIDTFHLSPAETKIVANALKFIKKEITLVDVNSTPNTEVMKVSGTVYITVPDATGLKLLFSDNQNLLKRLVSLQGFLNTPQRTTTSISVPMFMEKRNFRKRSFREGSSGSSPFVGMNKSGTPKFTMKDWKKLKDLITAKKIPARDEFLKFFPDGKERWNKSIIDEKGREDLVNWSRAFVED